MLNLDSYLDQYDGKVHTLSDELNKKYLDTPMSETELKKYNEIKPLLQELVNLQNKVNMQVTKLYGSEKDFHITCVMNEPYRGK